MKTKELKNIVKAISKIVGRNTVIPIIENVLIDFNRIKFTDLEVFVSIKLPNTELGSVEPYLLSAKEFKELAADFTELKFSQHDVEKRKITFNADGADISFAGDKPDEMPINKYPHPDKLIYQFTPTDVESMADSLKYVGCNPYRLVMTQVGIVEGHVVSTDACKLYFNPLSKVCEGKHLFQPKAVEVMNIFGGYWDFLKSDDGNVLLTNGDVEISFKEMDERYPDVFSVIPKDNPIAISIDAEDLSKTLTQSLKFANATTKAVKLGINGSLSISAEDIDFGKEYSKSITKGFVHTGEDITIGFNGKFLLDIIKNLNTDVVTMTFGTTTRATIINEKVLLMPVIIS